MNCILTYFLFMAINILNIFQIIRLAQSSFRLIVVGCDLMRYVKKVEDSVIETVSLKTLFILYETCDFTDPAYFSLEACHRLC